MSATRVRDWATVDYYAILGVPGDASDADIAQAFRTRAKQLHPDATDDPGAHARFHDLSAAYEVLSDHRRRRDYDRVRAATDLAVVPRPARPPARTRWTRRRAWYALVGGTIVAILGVGAAFLTWSLHASDANRRARFVPVAAERVDDGKISFVTASGQHITTNEPHQHGEASGTSPTVAVRYDPADPHHVIVDAGTFGRDITLAIVALKFLIGGTVFAVLGARHLRRGARVTAAR